MSALGVLVNGRDERLARPVPCWCPVCELVMRGHKHNQTYYDLGCCYDCFIEFVEYREQRWLDGWRPSAEEIASRRHRSGEEALR
jgi:hypothetical protein